MTTDTLPDTLHVLRLVARPESQWRPADYPPCAIAGTDTTNRASLESRADGNTAACSAYVDRLRARAVACELRLRGLSDELHRVRLAKAALEQEIATAARRRNAQSDGQQMDGRGEGAL